MGVPQKSVFVLLYIFSCFYNNYSILFNLKLYDIIKLIKIPFKYTTEQKLIIIITNLNEMLNFSLLEQIVKIQTILHCD